MLKFGDLDGSRSLLLWQRSESEIWLDNSELREQGLGLIVLDTRMDNHIVARDPVDWGGNTMLVACLKGVDNTENLGGVTAGRSRVGENETDSLLWVDDKDRADSESNTLGIDVGGVLVVKHVIGISYLALLVANDGESKLAA